MPINLSALKPDIRRLAEMKDILFDRDWLKTAPDDLELYYMYRDLAENEQDKEKITKGGLRYDITLLKPILLGQEFNKTAGHDHPFVPQSQLTYPEIYEVLEGKAIFLLQDSEKDIIKDVYSVKAEQNDKIIIPPNYEHLMLNPESTELKTANWVSREFSSNIYKPFRSKHGFSYFALKNKTGEIEWVKNKNYASIPDLRFLEPNQGLEKFGLDKNQPMYALVNNLTKLDFLNQPEKYDWQ